MLIGHIKEIVRYPVKSFTGEKVEDTHVLSYGLYGDRSHAYLDKTRPGKYLTITQAPFMCTYQASFADHTESLERFPEVNVYTPDGKSVNWDDPWLIQKLEKRSNRQIQPVKYTPVNVPIGAIEEEDLLIVTDASLSALREQWGNQLDYRRFRPNLLLDLINKVPYIEETWFGKRLYIGEQVEIEMKRPCERCMIITVDPKDSERDPSLLKIVAKERNNHFGVYASVIRTGPIHTGDEVILG